MTYILDYFIYIVVFLGRGFSNPAAGLIRDNLYFFRIHINPNTYVYS